MTTEIDCHVGVKVCDGGYMVVSDVWESGEPKRVCSVFTDLSNTIKCVERSIKLMEGDTEFDPPKNEDGTYSVRPPK